MKILATGDSKRLKELREKIDTSHSLAEKSMDEIYEESWNDYDLVFDLNADDDPHRLQMYCLNENKILVAGAVKTSLSQFKYPLKHSLPFTLVGMNMMPTMIGRSVAEVSFLNKKDETVFDSVAKILNWKYLAVEDRVGMITPRVVTMIINEACFTMQEGTATKEDIDEAMKLGTSYPFGPFEWCDRIGIKEVYEVLNAVWKDTHDERYKVCPLLKSKYLRSENFYRASEAAGK